jgi:hypothetical protein
MDVNKNNWKVGELVNLPRTETLLKKRGMTRYERLVESRYICIREATDTQRGILVKAMGKVPMHHIIKVGGGNFL